MATKKYDYNYVINLCTPNSRLDRELQELQTELKKLNMDIQNCENHFHGKGYNSKIYESYEELYRIIGKENTGGCWKLINNIINTVDKVKYAAENDLDDYNDELEKENENTTS